jgi:hypothetical protein
MHRKTSWIFFSCALLCSGTFFNWFFSKRNKFGVQEATEVLWEADDDHTGALDVQDLVELYFRVTTDATGYEPRRLFCMLEFLLFSAPSVCSLPLQGVTTEFVAAFYFRRPTAL